MAGGAAEEEELAEAERLVAFFSGQAEGGKRREYASALQALGGLCLRSGRHDRAYAAYSLLGEQGARQGGEGGTLWAGAAYGNMGTAASLGGDKARACWHFEHEALVAHQLGDPMWEGRARGRLGCALRHWHHQLLHQQGKGDAQQQPAGAEGDPQPQVVIERAKVECREALRLGDEAGDKVGAARARAWLGMALESGGDAPAALEQHTMQVKRRIRDKDLGFGAAFDLAMLAACVARGGPGGAKRAAPVLSFLKALSDLGGDTRLQARASGNLGAAVAMLGMLDLGIKWHLGAMKSSVTSGDWGGLSVALTNLSRCYAAHAGGGAHAGVCAEAVKAWSLGDTELRAVTARLAAMPPPERPKTRANNRGPSIEEVTVEEVEQTGRAGAGAGADVRGGRGKLKQRVGLLNTWKDRSVILEGNTLTILRTGRSTKGEDSLVQTIEMRGCTVLEKAFRSQPFAIEIRPPPGTGAGAGRGVVGLVTPGGGGGFVFLAAGSLQERQAWLQCLSSSSRLPPSPQSGSATAAAPQEAAPAAKRGVIGAVLWQGVPGGPVWVQQLIKGSTAEACGQVKAGDEVLSVDGARVDKGWDAVAISHNMGGTVGTKVALGLRRQGEEAGKEGETYAVEIERA